MSHLLHARVLILGGGLNGLSLACCLGEQGISAAVFDRESYKDMEKASFDGRTTAVSAGMKNMLGHLGIWKDLAKTASPIETIEIRDGRSPFYLNFAAEEVGDEPVGYIVENHRLRRALITRARAHRSVTLIDEAGIKNLNTEPDGVHLTSGTQNWQGELLVGADGRRSTVRKTARIRQKSWDYGQSALVFIVRHSLDHHQRAYECFFPEGPLAFLPMQNNRSQVVWTRPRPQAATDLRTAPRDLMARLQARFGDALGDLELDSKILVYPLSFNHAYTYVAPRVALIGDAAHGLHPIAGQGLNLGMRDVASLAELIESRGPGDLGEMSFLKRYDRARKPDILAFIAATDGLNRLFGVENPLLAKPRQLGIAAIEKLPALKKFFIRQAMGQGQGIPRLFKKTGSD